MHERQDCDKKPCESSRILVALLVLVGAVAITFGLCVIVSDLIDARRYQDLAKKVTKYPSGKSLGSVQDEKIGIDWSVLLYQNAQTVAWVKVEGTSINLPVVATSTDKPNWYLAHDFWGEKSESGCPFLDSRSNANGLHALVYGHHMSVAHVMFSDLRGVYRQDDFDALGNMTWSTPAAGDKTLVPLCALRVDSGYEQIQNFDFASATSVETWLTGLLEDADARSEDAKSLIAKATRAVTLVTCSSMVSNQKWRTVVVFVDNV